MFKIVVDSKEAAIHPGVIQELKKQFDVEEKNLYSADYVPSSRCGIEVKTVTGIINDWKEGRLKSQMSKLTSQFDKPTLIIIGSLSQIEEQSAIQISTYITSLLNLWLNHGIATFFISDRHLIPFLSSAIRIEAGLVQEKNSIRE